LPPAGRPQDASDRGQRGDEIAVRQGIRDRKRRVRVIAATNVGRSSSPAAAITRAAGWATVRWPAGTVAGTGVGSSTAAAGRVAR
jgi:hypothetical protein